MKTPNFFTAQAFPLVLATLAIAPATILGKGAQIGEPAAPLRLAEILQAPEGTDATWEKLRGKVVVLDFWATWCGPCVASIPHWNELALQFRDKPVVFIAISDENKDIVTSFLKRKTIASWVGLEGITNRLATDTASAVFQPPSLSTSRALWSREPTLHSQNLQSLRASNDLAIQKTQCL